VPVTLDQRVSSAFFQSTRGRAPSASACVERSTYPVHDHQQTPELQTVLPEWRLSEMTIHALYASRRHLSPAVRALLDFLVERFRSPPW